MKQITTPTSPHDRETRLKGKQALEPIQWLDFVIVDELQKKIEYVLEKSVDIVVERSDEKLERTEYDYDDLHCPRCDHVQLINKETCNVRDEDKPVNKFVDHLTLCAKDQATLDYQNKYDLMHDDIIALLRQAQDKQKKVQVTPVGSYKGHQYVLKVAITSPLAHLICRGAKIVKRKTKERAQFEIHVKVPIEDGPSSATPPTMNFIIDFKAVFDINLACKKHLDKKEKESQERAEKLAVKVAAGQVKRPNGVVSYYDGYEKPKVTANLDVGLWSNSSGRPKIANSLLDDTDSFPATKPRVPMLSVKNSGSPNKVAVDAKATNPSASSMKQDKEQSNNPDTRRTGKTMKRAAEKAAKKQKIQEAKSSAMMNVSGDQALSNDNASSAEATKSAVTAEMENLSRGVSDMDMKDVSEPMPSPLPPTTGEDSNQIPLDADVGVDITSSPPLVESPIEDNVMEEDGCKDPEQDAVSNTVPEPSLSKLMNPNGNNDSSGTEKLDQVEQLTEIGSADALFPDCVEDAAMDLTVEMESGKDEQVDDSQDLAELRSTPDVVPAAVKPTLVDVVEENGLQGSHLQALAATPVEISIVGGPISCKGLRRGATTSARKRSLRSTKRDKISQEAASSSTPLVRKQRKPNTSTNECIVLSDDDKKAKKKEESAVEVIDLDSSSSSDECMIVLDTRDR